MGGGQGEGGAALAAAARAGDAGTVRARLPPSLLPFFLSPPRPPLPPPPASPTAVCACSQGPRRGADGEGAAWAQVRRLLAGGESPDAKVSQWAQDDDLRPLHLASYHGHAEVARLLLEHGADPVLKARDSYTPLHYAVFCGKHDVARALITAGADPLVPDLEGASPVSLAAKRKDEAMLAVLTGQAVPVD